MKAVLNKRRGIAGFNKREVFSMEDTITFAVIQRQDVEELSPIIKRAFDEDSRIHLGREEGGPPGYDDGSFLRKWVFNSGTTAYKIYQDNKLIGGVILWINPSKHNFLGTIFLDPMIENKGVGTKVWRMIENMYPDTISWSTETPIFSRRNHNFYINKCGFSCVKIDKPKDYEQGMFILKKFMKK